MLLISGDAVIWGKPGYSFLGEKVLNLAFPIITKKEAKRTCGFYRQHIPYLVVLFQSICQVIKNIQCWVSARARGSFQLIQVAMKAALPLSSQLSWSQATLNPWKIGMLSGVCDNPDGKSTILGILWIQIPSVLYKVLPGKILLPEIMLWLRLNLCACANR